MKQLNNSHQIIYHKDRLILVSFGLGLLINIVLWVLAVDKFGYAHELMPLHFNIVYGIDYVGSSRQIYELPLAGLMILILNAWLGKLLYQGERLWSYFLTFSALIIQVFFLLAFITLVRLNG